MKYNFNIGLWNDKWKAKTFKHNKLALGMNKPIIEMFIYRIVSLVSLTSVYQRWIDSSGRFVYEGIMKVSPTPKSALYSVDMKHHWYIQIVVLNYVI